MKSLPRFILSRIGIGLLFAVPVYLSILLILKALSSIKGLLQPIKLLLPAWLQADALLALLLLVGILFVIGVLIHTALGKHIRDKIERLLFQQIPGYSLFRSFAQRVAGETAESTWKPALVETDDLALMPAFIIEELPDGRYTIFVPSVPTPLAGAVFIYPRERVHPVNIPFSKALKVVTHWGEGAKELVAAMDQEKRL